MQQWCLEYKNVEYYSFSLKALNGKKKKKKIEGWRRETKNKKPHREKKYLYEIQPLVSI